MDYSIADISVWLFSCDATSNNQLLSVTNTNIQGIYTFDEVADGRYYVNIQSLPPWYVFSSVWKGNISKNGTLTHPDVDSTVNPLTGSTVCFEVVDGAIAMNWSVGLRLNVPPVTSPVSPSEEETLTPSSVPTNETASSSPPTLSSEKAVVVGGYVFNDINNNGYYDSKNETTIPNVRVSLLDCKSGSIVNTKETNSTGYYKFSDLKPNNYYVTFSYCVNPPDPCYQASQKWSGLFDFTVGNFTSPDADNKVNPDTGSSICKSYVEGDFDLDVNAGMLFVSGNVTVDDVASESPSAAPSNATMNPSLSPSVVVNVTESPTDGTVTPSASSLPSSAPSMHPTRFGETVGPSTTSGLIMTLHGIDTLEDEEGWSMNTSHYIMDYFNLERNFAFDVEVEIYVTKQTPNNRPFKQQERRQQEGKAVEITYDQTTTYKTPDPSTVSLDFILEEPFATNASQTEYILFLQNHSSYYDEVTTASVTLPPNDVDKIVTPPDDEEDNGGINWMPITIGVACGVGALLIVMALLIVVRRRRRRNHEMEPVGNGNPTAYVNAVGGDLEGGNEAGSSGHTPAGDDDDE